MKNLFRIVLILSFFSAKMLLAQDKIMFLNGKKKEVYKVLGVSDDKLIYRKAEGDSVSKLSAKRIFSITKKSKKEEFVYRRDTTIDNDLTIPQMQMYIKGMQDGEKYYHSPFSTIEGLAFGVAGGLIIPIYSSLSFIPPGLGVLAVSIPTPNMEKQPIMDKDLLKNTDYVQGYLKRAKDRKIKNAIIGGGIGLLGTLGVLLISGNL